MLKKHCCTEPTCSSNQRNRYFQGKRLTPAALETEQAYSLIRRRLINQMIHGTGVVAGFQVQPSKELEGEDLEIGKGFAIDALGRELIQTEETVLAFDRLYYFGPSGERLTERGSIEAFLKSNESLLISAHYAEVQMGPVTINSACSCDRSEWDYVCESIRYSVRPWKKTTETTQCVLECNCEERQALTDTMRAERGACCINNHITNRIPNIESKLKAVEEDCEIVNIDFDNGVPLAKVKLELFGNTNCSRIKASNIESCGIRRLIKHNDLLFDLIRGCDLTGIESTSWQNWAEEIPKSTFVESFIRGSEVPNTRLHVRFTKNVQVSSLRPHALAVTVLFRDGEGGWWETDRAPVTKLEPIEPADGLAIGFTASVPQDWIKDTFEGYSRFDKHEARIEIEVRGDVIIDCNGQAVDANGNGTPGGTLLSCHILTSEMPQQA